MHLTNRLGLAKDQPAVPEIVSPPSGYLRGPLLPYLVSLPCSWKGVASLQPCCHISSRFDHCSPSQTRVLWLLSTQLIQS